MTINICPYDNREGLGLPLFSSICTKLKLSSSTPTFTSHKFERAPHYPHRRLSRPLYIFPRPCCRQSQPLITGCRFRLLGDLAMQLTIVGFPGEDALEPKHRQQQHRLHSHYSPKLVSLSLCQTVCPLIWRALYRRPLADDDLVRPTFFGRSYLVASTSHFRAAERWGRRGEGVIERGGAKVALAEP